MVKDEGVRGEGGGGPKVTGEHCKRLCFLPKILLPNALSGNKVMELVMDQGLY